jgi:uncharacterized repeat protein (TIGR02543 family)
VTLASGSGLSRSGYTFGGWNTNTSGTGTNYNAGSTYTPTGNLTLYAKWNVATYTVTYNINSGSGTTPAAQMVSSGSSITLPSGSGLSRTNYTFGGWNTNTSGTGTNYNAGSSYTPTSNITLYAKWTVTYTVTYNINSGSGTTPSAQTAGSGSSITLPSGSGLSRTGYTFGGWNTNTSGTGNNYSPGSSYTVTGNITLYAKWEDASTVWTVKFETNGGSAVGDALVLKNTAVSRPSPDSAKTGYTFDGWYTNTGLTSVYNFSSIVTGNITLYAKWNAITYTVAYNANSGTGSTANSSHTYDVDKNLTSNGFTRSNYTFSGWARTSTGAVEFTNSQSVRNITVTAGETVTLYAQWNPITYTVTFNSNSGSGTTPSAQTAKSRSAIALPSGSGLSGSGYPFGGWNTNTSGTGTNYSAGSSYTVNANITLYARWDSPGAEFSPLPLTVNTWANGSITSSTSGGAVWYSFNVVSGTTYYVWWNDTDNSGGTLDVKVAAYYSSGNNIFDVDNSGTNTQSFTANSTGTVKIKVYPYSGSSTGTFAVAYSTANTRPGIIVSGSTLAAKLSWLQTNAQSNGNYILEVSANESISPTTLSYSGKTNIGITLRGTGAVRTVSLSSNGAMFTVASGVTLTLDNNITLQGRSSNTNSLVRVNSGGTLVMKAGSTVTGNTYYASNSSTYGGGVYVSGTFTMSGGTISGNTVSSDTCYGGGVYVSSGTFTKTGGTIYGYSASDTTNSNVVKNSSGTVQSNMGHAVYVSSGSKRRESTAGTSVNLDSTKTGTAGGWN